MVPDTDVINIIEEMSTTTQVHNTYSKDKNSFSSLKEKISRTAQFLQDLKLISQDCQDLEADQDDKEKQIFNRRIGEYWLAVLCSIEYTKYNVLI